MVTFTGRGVGLGKISALASLCLTISATAEVLLFLSHRLAPWLWISRPRFSTETDVSGLRRKHVRDAKHTVVATWGDHN